VLIAAMTGAPEPRRSPRRPPSPSSPPSAGASSPS